MIGCPGSGKVPLTCERIRPGAGVGGPGALSAQVLDQRSGPLPRGQDPRELPIAWVTADSAYGQELGRLRPRASSPVAWCCGRWPPICSPSRSHRRSSSLPGSGASTSSSARHRTMPGSNSPAVMAPRARACSTGLPRSCRSSTSSTVTSPRTAGGFWHAAASRGRTRSPTTLPMRRPAARPLTWSSSPAPAGPSRSASRLRRTSAAWTSTRSAAIRAGIDTSPWRCSPTPSSPRGPRPSSKGGPKKRFRSPRAALRGRSSTAPGNLPSPGQHPDATTVFMP